MFTEILEKFAKRKLHESCSNLGTQIYPTQKIEL